MNKTKRNSKRIRKTVSKKQTFPQENSSQVRVLNDSTPSEIVTFSQRSPIQNIKEWLTDNKIFFETIAATMLTFMAVILSFAQLAITQEQTAYLEQQIIIEREQALPQFVVISKTFPGEGTNQHEDDKIFMYNQGNTALNITTKVAVFFNIDYLNGPEQKDILVPVDGYYWWHVMSGESTGLVVTIENPKNHLKRSIIEDELSKLAAANNVIINLNIKRYVQITYRDIFDELHTKYYLVVPFSGGELVQVDDGEKLFVQHQEGFSNGKMFDIDANSALDLFNLVTKDSQ